MTDDVARELISAIKEMAENERAVLRYIRERDERTAQQYLAQYEEGKAYKIARDKLLDDRSFAFDWNKKGSLGDKTP